MWHEPYSLSALTRIVDQWYEEKGDEDYGVGIDMGEPDDGA